MGIMGLTPTQPTKTHTHACMTMSMGCGRLGEDQLWVGYRYNPQWVILGYPSEEGNLVYTEDTAKAKKKKKSQHASHPSV